MWPARSSGLLSSAFVRSHPALPPYAGAGGVILMDYVQISPDIPSLGSLNLDSVAKLRRKKWAGQIRSIVQQLHDIGVVWGDAKPGNILIGKKDNAWIIDFGGSWTEGWVDPELTDSMKGDLQALKRIILANYRIHSHMDIACLRNRVCE